MKQLNPTIIFPDIFGVRCVRSLVNDFICVRKIHKDNVLYHQSLITNNVCEHVERKVWFQTRTNTWNAMVRKYGNLPRY